MTEQERKKKYAELERDINADPLSRHWALYKLLEDHPDGLTIKQICDMVWIKDGDTYIKPYEYRDTAKCQSNHCPQFYADRTFINLNLRFDKMIVRDGDKWMIATEEQAKAEYQECIDRANYYHMIEGAIGRKMRRNGDGKLLTNDLKPMDENSKAKPFHESYRKEPVYNIFGVEVDDDGTR